MTNNTTYHTSDVCLAMPGTDTSQLCELAVKGLVSMFDAERQLFCFRLRRTPHGLVREELSHRYTIIALLGLHQLEAAGLRSPIDIRAVLDSLLRDYAWIDNLGDAGLLLWLCALLSPERIMEVVSGVRLETALTRFRGARRGSTMELAWFLSGLSHASLALPQQLPELTELAVDTCGLLTKNQGAQGIFGHLARKGSLAGVLRGHIGSFADQVYPIYALTKFAEAYKLEFALDRARSCAEAICRAKGPQGQWWWHYDSSTGKVFEKYPVYSVHQHGMAPMALFVLGEAARVDFSTSVQKGLSWIRANNELEIDVRDPASGVIWRSIYGKKRYKIYIRRILSLLGYRGDMESVRDLAVRYECWSYELGWLLYALAGLQRASSEAF
ncbi:MAG: hypothetical protein WCC87_13650 [Candidatus Korobacteraceae bacterium]